MATSGSFLTSVGSGAPGSPYPNRMIFEWRRTGWGRSGNRGYHDISYTLKTYGGSSGYYVNYHNRSMNVDGTGYSGGTIAGWGNGATTLLSGSKRLWTNSAGNRSFSASAKAGIYTYAVNSSGSGSWSLDNIPMHASITGTSGNINDESNPYISFSNPGGGNVTAWLSLPNLTGTTRYAQRNNYKTGVNFSLTTGERNAIRSAMANTKSTTIRYHLQTNNTGNVDTRNSTISITNANPAFSTVNYSDSNGATTAITGNDQYIIQGKSTINVNLPTPAVAQKGASMVKYTATINNTSKDFNYSGSAINETLVGKSNGASSNQTLSVTATDSRGNTTTVQKTVLMVPYSNPVINIVAEREDSFGEDTEIDISGTYSVLNVNGVSKNVVDSSTGVSYRLRELGAGAWGSWVDITSTTSGNSITTPTDPIETLHRDTAFELQARIIDLLNPTGVTALFIIPIGRSAFRIGSDGLLYNNGNRVHATLDLYPVGTVLITSVNTNPQYNLGGTWVSTTNASQSLFGMTMYGWRRSA